MFGSGPSRKVLISFLVLIFLIHGWSLTSSAYFHLWWLDILLHFLGGFWLGLLALYLLKDKNIFSQPYFSLLLVLALVALGGVLWEIGEYILDELVLESVGMAQLQPGLEDTISDLISDLIGGALASFIFQKRGPAYN